MKHAGYRNGVGKDLGYVPHCTVGIDRGETTREEERVPRAEVDGGLVLLSLWITASAEHIK